MCIYYILYIVKVARKLLDARTQESSVYFSHLREGEASLNDFFHGRSGCENFGEVEVLALGCRLSTEPFCPPVHLRFLCRFKWIEQEAPSEPVNQTQGTRALIQN